VNYIYIYIGLSLRLLLREMDTVVDE